MEDPGAAAGYLRKHLIYDMVNVLSCAGFRTFCFPRGIRGEAGVRWATECLKEDGDLLDALEDTRTANAASSLREALQRLARLHEAEEARRVFAGDLTEMEARKFSQHHEGRHASQRGKHCLAV